MSYDIYIGNAVVETWDDGKFHVRVGKMSVEEAPSFPNDHMTGKGNSRHPAYSGWSNFCREAGLYDLFFDKEDGLMRDHPGTFQITKTHLEAVRVALMAWVKAHPNTNPGFEEDDWMKPEFRDKIINPDPILARLIWLEFWMNWAIENCENPAIHNH